MVSGRGCRSRLWKKRDDPATAYERSVTRAAVTKRDSSRLRMEV